VSNQAEFGHGFAIGGAAIAALLGIDAHAADLGYLVLNAHKHGLRLQACGDCRMPNEAAAEAAIAVHKGESGGGGGGGGHCAAGALPKGTRGAAARGGLRRAARDGSERPEGRVSPKKTHALSAAYDVKNIAFLLLFCTPSVPLFGSLRAA
jgi:hypothetical protein